MSVTHVKAHPAIEAEVLARAAARYPGLPDDSLARIARAAATSLQRDPRSESGVLAAHVTVARLVGSHMVRLDPAGLLRAEVAIGAPDEAASVLAPLLCKRLTYEELLMAAVAARGITLEVAAQVLNLDPIEAERLSTSAHQKAFGVALETHVPSCLSSDEGAPTVRGSVVKAHVAGCDGCNEHFAQLAWWLFGHAGARVQPLPPLYARHAVEQRLCA
jgi:hypothetical protein